MVNRQSKPAIEMLAVLGADMGVIVNFSFLRSRGTTRDWTPQEIGEFYRVESALAQAGLLVSTDRGLTDEGDPWFVFCRQDSQEVIAHFARINNQYIIVSSAFAGVVQGTDFRALVGQLLESSPLMLPIRRQQGQKILLHPAALLVALVAAAYVMTGDKAPPHEAGSDLSEKQSWLSSWLRQEFAFLSAVTIAVSWLENHSDGTLVDLVKNALVFQHDGSAGDSANVAPAGSRDVAALDAFPAANPDSAFGAHTSADKQAVTIPSDDQSADAGPAAQGLNATIVAANANVRNAVGDHDQSSSADQVGHVEFVLTAEAPLHSGRGADVWSSAPEWAASEPDVLPVPAASVASQLGSANSVTATDAFHLLASELPVAQPVVLSTSQSTLGFAIEQAISQAGIPGAQLHSNDEIIVAAEPAQGGANSAVSSSDAITVPQSVTSPSPIPSVASSPSPSVASSPSPSPSVASSPSPSSTPATADTPATASNTVDSPPVVTEAAVAQDLVAFLQNTPSYEVMVSGQILLIVDTNPADAKSPDFGVRSWDLPDGSIVSVVGIISHTQTVAA